MKNKRIQNVWLSLIALVVTVAVLYGFNHISGQQSTKKPRTLLFTERFQSVVNHPVNEVIAKNGMSNVRINSVDGVSEPSIGVNPVDTRFIAVGTNDFRITGNNARLFYSADKGANWNSTSVPMSGIAGYTETTDPSVTFDADGTLYYAMVHYQSFGNGDGIFVNRSFDNGATWMQKASEVRKNNDPLVFEDRPVITADRSNSSSRNTLYVTWVSLENGISKILVSKSINKGQTFSSPVLVAQGKVNTPDIKAYKDGKVYVTWLSNDNAIYISKSENAGSSFSSPVLAVELQHSGILVNNVYLLKQNAASGVKVKSYPRIAVDNTNGKVYISYSARSGQDLSNVYYICSNDEGNSWASPIQVNDDNTMNDQFAPEIVAANGQAVISWQDSRNDANNRLVGTYCASITECAVGVNKQVSTTGFEPSNILLNNYIGDYNGVAVTDKEIVSVWTDGRNGLFDLYAGFTPLETSGSDKEITRAADFTVAQNYPNPFNPSTVINYQLPNAGNVSVTLFDMNGREVTELFSGYQSAGSHSVIVNAQKAGYKLASGSYVYTVRFGGQSISKKLTLLK